MNAFELIIINGRGLMVQLCYIVVLHVFFKQ